MVFGISRNPDVGGFYNQNEESTFFEESSKSPTCSEYSSYDRSRARADIHAATDPIRINFIEFFSYDCDTYDNYNLFEYDGAGQARILFSSDNRRIMFCIFLSCTKHYPEGVTLYRAA